MFWLTQICIVPVILYCRLNLPAPVVDDHRAEANYKSDEGIELQRFFIVESKEEYEV